MSKAKARAKADILKYEEEHTTYHDDDYEVAANKIDWNLISDEYISNSDRSHLRLLQGHSSELLAPDADIAAIFCDPDQSVSVAQSFIRVLELRNPKQLTYILTLLSNILQNDNRRGKVFLALDSKNSNMNLIQSFQRVWLRDEIPLFCQGKAAICASVILQSSSQVSYLDKYQSLTSWILRQFKSKRNDQLLSPLYALKGIIGNALYQQTFLSEGGVSKLMNIIFENDDHRQVIYLTVYCLWVASFSNSNGDALKQQMLNGQLIAKCVKFVKRNLSLKVSRVCLALFENLMNYQNFNEMVVLFELFPVLEQMEQEEKYDDDELNSSVSKLLDGLEKDVKILSSFERYEQEIRSEKLLWGPCHTESFWKKYNQKLEDDNYKLIRALLSFLDSKDAETVAVACYDIGEWSRFYPDAKAIIEKLNGKFKLMKLIDHRDDQVKQFALNAVQKVLVRNWKSEHKSPE